MAETPDTTEAYELKIAKREFFLMQNYTKAQLAFALAQFEIGDEE